MRLPRCLTALTASPPLLKPVYATYTVHIYKHKNIGFNITCHKYKIGCTSWHRGHKTLICWDSLGKKHYLYLKFICVSICRRLGSVPLHLPSALRHEWIFVQRGKVWFGDSVEWTKCFKCCCGKETFFWFELNCLQLTLWIKDLPVFVCSPACVRSSRASRSALPTSPFCAASPCWSHWSCRQSTSGEMLRTASQRKTVAETASKRHCRHDIITINNTFND